MDENLIEFARRTARLSQDELAARAGTSRTTLSAYEHGRKSPTIATAERILGSAGLELAAVATVNFREVSMGRGRAFFVADRWWRLPTERAFAEVSLPLSLNWSMPDSTFRLANRRQRARCYEIVLREGLPADIRAFVDGALMVDIWAELVLPREIHTAWQPLVDSVTA